MDGTLLLPIFPLPGVVFFPETELPLHVFEPRYRDLVADALDGDGTIGIQLLDPSGVIDSQGHPAVLDIGCAGNIVEYEALEDGRSNILLKGLYRYRIESEKAGRVYRLAEVRQLPIVPLQQPTYTVPGPDDMRRMLTGVVNRLAISVGRAEAGDLPLELSDEGLVNEAATRLGLDAEDRYRLLTMDRLDERYRWVIAHISTLQLRLELLAPYRRAELNPRFN